MDKSGSVIAFPDMFYSAELSNRLLPNNYH